MSTSRNLEPTDPPSAENSAATTHHHSDDAPQNGIDIRQALSILSARSEQMEENSGKDGCGCCSGNEVPESAKSMGQTIDILATPTSKHSEQAASSQTEEERVQEQQRLENERKERQENIRTEIQSMSEKELLQAVMQAQQERVATYKEYENGLLMVLHTGNMTSYPDTCSKATASFSVLSDTIRVIKEILDSRYQRKDLSKLVTRLQNHEREKLQLTAAIHLERIRQRDQQIQAEQDPRISKLLQDGVQTLQQKIQTVVEQINEVLDEIRCSILEEE